MGLGMKIRIKLIRSTIGKKPVHRRNVAALGLKRINSTVEHEAVPSILGMVRAVAHMVEVEEI